MDGIVRALIGFIVWSILVVTLINSYDLSSIRNQLKEQPIKPTLQLMCAESRKVQSTHNAVFTCVMHKDRS
jgi:hypothetical protein